MARNRVLKDSNAIGVTQFKSSSVSGAISNGVSSRALFLRVNRYADVGQRDV